MLTLSRNPISSNTGNVDSLLARSFNVNSRLRAQRRTIKSSGTSKARAFATRAERDPPPLEHGRPQPKKYGNYENAAWIRSMTAKDEVKNRELTETEKEAFLARREQRLGQIQVKKELLKSFKEADMKKAWSLHDKLSHRDQWSYNQMIAVAAKGGFVQKAFSLYQKMKKVPLQPSIGTYHWLLQACANGQGEGEYLARAFYVIEQMKQQNLKLNLHSYNLILQICANAKDVEAAGEVLRKMQADGISADISSLSSLLNCMRGPNLAPIQQVWSEIKSKFTPDARSWNTYISVLRDSGFIQETVQAFKEMLTAPMPSEFDPDAEPSPQVPSAYTLSLVMDACGDAKLYNESRLILYRIMTPEWRSVIKFDDILFQSMLRTASRLKSNAVFTVVGLMEEKKVPITPATRSTIIMAYGRTGDLKEATKHFEAARMAGELNLRCFTGLLIACRTSKDADRAWLTFEVLRRSNLRYDDVFVRILTEIFSSSGRPDLMAKLKVVLEEKEVQKSSKLQAKKENGAQKNESSMPPSPTSSTPHTSEPHIKERLQYPQRKEAERHQEAQTPLIKMRTLKSATILPTANTPSSQQINPLPRAPPVILPSTEPNAGRSMFFAKERLAKLREKQQGDEDL